jgi:flagellum-specific ATP synthase
MDEPIADSVRSILDGHIVLSRKIAQRNQFPAVDVLQSASRVMRSVIAPEHLNWSAQIKEWLALYQSAEDLINVGAYVKGANPRIDQAIHVQEKILEFLKQGIDDQSNLQEALARMHSIVRSGEAFASSMQSQSHQQRGNSQAQNSRTRNS